jgi:predicted phosphodiesterase
MVEEMYIKIAVISDLHCQREENSSKVTRLHTQLLDNPPNKNPIEALKRIIEQEQKEVDYFFVLGDITNKADIDGFILGMKLIKEINYSLKASKLICTIGNHDMYGHKDMQDPEIIMKGTNGFPFLFKDKSTEDIEENFWGKDFCIIEDDKSILLVINSSRHIKSSSSKALEISESVLSNMESKLSPYQITNKVKIALTHHHPIPHSDFDNKYTSLDCLEYGDKLTALLNKNHFTLLLHGHKHFPRIKFEDQLPIFCSGSFSSLENTYCFNEDNTTHFIEIYKNGNSFKGFIETWIFNERVGWKQSTDLKVRFPVITGFGLQVDIPSFIEDFYSYFFKSKENTNEIYVPIPYDKVIEKFSDFKFFSIYQQKEFEEKLFEKYLISINLNQYTLKRTFVKNLNK